MSVNANRNTNFEKSLSVVARVSQSIKVCYFRKVGEISRWWWWSLNERSFYAKFKYYFPDTFSHICFERSLQNFGHKAQIKNYVLNHFKVWVFKMEFIMFHATFPKLSTTYSDKGVLRVKTHEYFTLKETCDIYSLCFYTYGNKTMRNEIVATLIDWIFSFFFQKYNIGKMKYWNIFPKTF